MIQFNEMFFSESKGASFRYINEKKLFKILHMIKTFRMNDFEDQVSSDRVLAAFIFQKCPGPNGDAPPF